MAGLREDKKRRTRQAIADVALRLFAERGFEAVTVNEIAEAAGVAKVTLFKYFPAKESLVLHAVEDEDLAGIVTSRPPGQTPLRALRAHFRAFAAEPDIGDPDELVARMKVIVDSPALTAAANRLHYGQRRALARALAGDDGPHPPCESAGPTVELAVELAAAQISAAVLTLQETFFQRIASGMPLAEAGRRLLADVDLAFDLLESGLESGLGSGLQHDPAR
ncbi:TetR family transcriptional regulator [Microtetraspora sp. NBRC 16547]|uniref:TetR family transcriptional regulator n=1 Tax=Microtetraspora sp. NBRC 16547 TaxID=3030993 RepID=UPI0024A0BE16|nr:TetR family transcriptional regulator [Microtetraspora sp. NBRC 16547]GLW97108.1 TetR family transcriptional regulator [Microtetraspora sp. NBRC 16547]